MDPRQITRASTSITSENPTCIYQNAIFTVLVFVTLYAPGIWSRIANQVLYPLIHNIHRSAGKTNVTPGVTVTNLFDEEVEVNKKLLDKMLQQAPLSHSTTAIYAADSWESENSTTKDIYDMIVKTSREVSPMCASINSTFRPMT